MVLISCRASDHGACLALLQRCLDAGARYVEEKHWTIDWAIEQFRPLREAGVKPQPVGECGDDGLAETRGYCVGNLLLVPVRQQNAEGFTECLRVEALEASVAKTSSTSRPVRSIFIDSLR